MDVNDADRLISYHQSVLKSPYIDGSHRALEEQTIEALEELKRRLAGEPKREHE